jgi:hypothetical protein
MLLYRELGEIEIESHHLLFLAEPGRRWSGRSDRRNQFVLAEPGVLCIFTGVAAGPVHVTVEHYDEPPPPDADGDPEWEELAEVDWPARTGEARFESMYTPTDAIGVVTPPFSTTYRVRVRARGRAVAYDWTVDTVTEYYLVQFWNLEPFDEPDDDYEEPAPRSPWPHVPPARHVPDPNAPGGGARQPPGASGRFAQQRSAKLHRSVP